MNKKTVVSLSLSFFLLLKSVCNCNAQTFQNKNDGKNSKAIDSILVLLNKDHSDTNKVVHLYQLANEYRLNEDFEKSINYTTEGLELAHKLNFKDGLVQLNLNAGQVYTLQFDYSQALKYYQEALITEEALNNKKEIADCLLKIGKIYIYQADYPFAQRTLNKALEINKEIQNKGSIALCLRDIGSVYMYEGNFPSAFNYYLDALKLNEELKNEEETASCIGNIGNVYLYQGDYTKALNYYFRALKMARDYGYVQLQSINTLNIALSYHQLRDYSTALDYYFKAQEMIEEAKDKNSIVSLYINIGICFRDQKNYSKALDYYQRAIKITEASGFKNRTAICMANIGEIYITTGKFKEAEKNMQSAIAIAESIGSMNYLMQFEQTLSDIYDTTKQYEKAFAHYKRAANLKDTLFSQENKQEMVSKEMTYEFDKKEAILKTENEKNLIIAGERNRKQQIIIWSVGGGLLLVFIFAGYVFRSLRIARKQKSIIELQKNEVSKQKDLADSQRTIAEELRAIAEKQRELVQEKQKEIVDSIKYAKRIQTALLASDEYIREHLSPDLSSGEGVDHFILFKPKDIVSGDFYWALSSPFMPGWDLGTNTQKLPQFGSRKNLFHLITADCTGHGVPGAFMSMLNISFLNEIVIKRKVYLPHDILNIQRKEIINVLNPPGSSEESKDGMDCILCVYDFDKMLLHFAAANNSLWMVRNGKLIEYKGDKMPVGKYDEKNEGPFTLHTIAIQKDDIFYTSTDGFADQFGMTGKKLMKKKFKEELLKIQHLPMSEQQIYLDNFFETWRSGTEQVDDVCVIGVKI
jgi:tetratricopeptide (TPR) repeat protein